MSDNTDDMNDLVLLATARDEAVSKVKELEAKLSKSEALLAKAVEALEFYSTLIGEKHECPWHMLSEDFGEKARTTLAALKGQDDE